MNDAPRISIVTPSYNQAEFIEETIRSVVLQGYPNLEYFIIDGGSTDGTIDIIKRYESWISGWVSERDNGQSDAIRKGVAWCSGDLVNWLNTDDYLVCGALWALARALPPMPAAIVLCGGALILDQGTGDIHDRPVQRTDPVLPNVPALSGGIQASYFLTRAAWQAVGGVNPALSYTMDSELHHRCHAMGVHFEPVHEAIAVYRRHPQTKTGSNWRQSLNCRRHYWTWLFWQLDAEQRAVYGRRLRRHLAGLYLSSISGSDAIITRLLKVALAIGEEPRMLFSAERLKRAARALLGRH